MPKFKSQEEYDDWRSQQAIKRQGAKDLKKLDAERPYYEGSKQTGGRGILVLAAAAAIAAAVLFFWPAGREFLAGLFKRIAP